MVRTSWLCGLFSALTGALALTRWPFPGEHALWQLVLIKQPFLFHAAHAVYVTLCFSTPYLAFSTIGSLVYIFAERSDKKAVAGCLPPYADPARREALCLVLGEVHQAKVARPAAKPHWLVIPDRGLFTGLMVLGAVGSGKTSGCMYPFAEQLLAYRASDAARRIGGLVLEVKGDFCHKVRGLLEKHGRQRDYLEVSLTSEFRYNPLYNDLDAYASAYGIASLLNNLFGRSKEPFWQQAYTNLVKFIILLYRLVDGYVTLFDVYQGAINQDILQAKIRQGDERLAACDSRSVVLGFDDFLSVRELEDFPFERDSEKDELSAPLEPELVELLGKRGVVYRIVTNQPPSTGQPPAWSAEQRDQFEAVKRWFYNDWLRMEPRLRTSIVEGISVFLSLFDDNPAVKRVFCPPKETYDPLTNADGRYGRPLPPFAELIERGMVCALNFPIGANPGLARTIGTLMKQDFQRAVLNRIPKLEASPERRWREVLFLCDEYQAFATVGENDPSGDEKFFALSRQARCIAIVATHSISSLRSTLPGEAWRTLLQTFRTKIFLALSDDFSARTASELCGKEEQLKPSYSLSEQGQDAGVSVLTGRALAHRASVGTTKTYSVQRDFVFEPKVFAELKNAQAIVLAYDGLNPWPASYCYLKPYYLDPNVGYFEQLAEGRL